MKKPFYVFLCLSIFSSCKDLYDEQLDYLLPPENKLALVEEEATGITEISSFEIKGNLNPAALFGLPISVFPEHEKIIVGWHKIDSEELEDLLRFFRENMDRSVVMNKIVNDLSEGEQYWCAAIYDVGNGFMGSDDFDMYKWIAIYLVDPDCKGLVYISYGKF